MKPVMNYCRSMICSALLLAGALTGSAEAAESALIVPGANLVKQGTDQTFSFTEGPAADAQGDVYFSDIFPEKIFKWSASDGKISTFREQTGQANGLAFDNKGRLIACEMTNNRVSRDDLQGKVEPIALSFDGAKLHMPNDVWVDAGGGVYFSDFAGMGAAVLPGETMQLYYVPANSKGPTDIRRATEDMSSPNGLIGTPDGKWLYAVDQGGVYRYSTGKDGALSERSLFVSDRADGMALDEQGNVYLAGEGIVVYSPKGERLTTIAVPEAPTNVTFAGADRKTLFITARTAIYTLQMAVKGAPTALDLARAK